MSASPPSQTAILHAVAARLGSTERPSSIDDTSSNTAKRVKAVWDIARRWLLAQHPWNFAITRHSLNADATAPAFGWERRFLLPSGCLRWLPPSEGDCAWFDGEIEGGYILTDATAPIAVRVISDHQDVTRWSPGFVMAMTCLVGDWAAEGVTQSTSINDRLTDMAMRALKTGKRIDGLETGQRRRGQVRTSGGWVRRMNFPYGGRG